MIFSAILVGLVGMAASFMPEELLRYAGSSGAPVETLLVQALGAAYVGFAMLNWTARDNLIGGIYSRPVALANFVHFTVVAIALVKALFAGHTGIEIVAASLAYAGFAVAFGIVLFTHPSRKNRADDAPAAS